MTRRPLTLLLSLILVLAACDGGSTADTTVPSTTSSTVTATVPTTSTTTTSTTTTTVPSGWPDLGMGTDDPPVLTVTDRCFGNCYLRLAVGATNLAIYGDGTVITTEAEVLHRGDEEWLEYTQARFSVPIGQLGEVYALAYAAGLVDGGSGKVGASRSSTWTIRTFQSRLGGDLVTVSAEDLFDPDSDGDDGPQRRALRALASAITDLKPPGGGEPFGPLGYVVTGTPDRGDREAVLDYPDLEIRAFEIVEIGGGRGRCLILEPDDPLAVELFPRKWPTPVTTRRGVWILQARPVYPHERTCLDLSEYGSSGSGITGTLRQQGGRRPGIDEPTSGRVGIWSNDRKMVTITVADTGEYSTAITPGTYRITATAHRLPCEEQTVTVPEGEIIDITVVCHIR